MMKRIAAVILIAALCIFLLVSCRKESTEGISFRATIAEINNGTMLVKPVEGSDELRSSDLFSINISKMPASPEPEVGDLIEITYTGEILEIYPATLSEIISIEIIEKADKTAIGNNKTALGERASVSGPYGQISIEIPENWEWKESPIDQEGIISDSGLYGIALKPKNAEKGHVELIYVKNIGLCGTGMTQEEINLSGRKAWQIWYDDFPQWFAIRFTDDWEYIWAMQIETDGWTEEMNSEVLQMLDTVRFDKEVVSGCVGQYIPESENDEIAVIMEVDHIIPSGAIVRFIQYDAHKTYDLSYGQDFVLERKIDDKWEPVPMVDQKNKIAFTAEGYPLPNGGEATIEVNWDWLYGALSSGTYRIGKQIVAHNANGSKVYTLYAQFIIT
ncbi:MAG: hypothetical protein J5589_07130 [Firmicutes bacterium]|nr:hypothetical protein [Bacillota bacterium]